MAHVEALEAWWLVPRWWGRGLGGRVGRRRRVRGGRRVRRRRRLGEARVARGEGGHAAGLARGCLQGRDVTTLCGLERGRCEHHAEEHEREHRDGRPTRRCEPADGVGRAPLRPVTDFARHRLSGGRSWVGRGGRATPARLEGTRGGGARDRREALGQRPGLRRWAPNPGHGPRWAAKCTHPLR